MDCRGSGASSVTVGLVVVLVATAACLAQSSASAPTRDEVRVKVDPEFVTVNADTRPVLRYRYAEVPFKPYIKELFTPRGVNVLLDSPPDHVHHHGLMYALAVNGVDFWAETQSAGKELDRGLEELTPESRAGGATAAFRQLLDWRAPDGKLLLQEQRTIRVLGTKEVAEADVTLLTWRTRLALPPGVAEATLSGNHYFGLGMRFVRAMDEEGTFLPAGNAVGEVFRGDERLTPARWCAYTAAVNGRAVTVAMFDHTANKRQPATWFTMKEPFAYLSATMQLHKEPLTLQAEKPIELRYGIALWDGPVDARRIDDTYRLWQTLESE
jgi:hypothetical protein